LREVGYTEAKLIVSCIYTSYYDVDFVIITIKYLVYFGAKLLTLCAFGRSVSISENMRGRGGNESKQDNVTIDKHKQKLWVITFGSLASIFSPTCSLSEDPPARSKL
jgi:hypothetical protein